MNVSGLTPMLLVKDIAAAIRFYESLGFAVAGTDETHYGAGNINWALLKLGAASIMLSVNGRDGEKPDQAFFLNVENADKFYEFVKDKVTLDHQLRDQFYGVRDFWFTDPFGFKWGAGHAISSDE